jgi:hypothetical protein
MSQKKNNTTAFAVAGAAIGGAIIGILAGIFGSKITNDSRESDLLDLRNRARVEVKKEQSKEGPVELEKKESH